MMTVTMKETKTNGEWIRKGNDGDSEGDGSGHHETTANGLKTMTGEDKNEDT